MNPVNLKKYSKPPTVKIKTRDGTEKIGYFTTTLSVFRMYPYTFTRDIPGEYCYDYTENGIKCLGKESQRTL